MIPIPKYLREIAEFVDNKKESLSFKIKCCCGSSNFWVYKNIPMAKGDKKLIQATENWWKEQESLFPHPPNQSYRDSENYFWVKCEVIKNGWYVKVYKAKDMPRGEPLEIGRASCRERV